MSIMQQKYWVTWAEWERWQESDEFGDKEVLEEAMSDLMEKKSAKDLASIILKWLTFKRVEEINLYLSNPQRDSRTYMECLRNIHNELEKLLSQPTK